jgi:hypothetical protein
MRAVAADGLEDKTKAAGERTAQIGSRTGRLGGGQQGPGGREGRLREGVVANVLLSRFFFSKKDSN